MSKTHMSDKGHKQGAYTTIALWSSSVGQVEDQSSCVRANLRIASTPALEHIVARHKRKHIRRTKLSVQPRLVSGSVREPPIRAADSDVKN